MLPLYGKRLSKMLLQKNDCVLVCTWRYRLEEGIHIFLKKTWWRHQMDTFSALVALCAGNSPVTGEFTAQRPVTRSFVVFFDLCLNKWLSKQSQCWWFETPSVPLWRYCNYLSNYLEQTQFQNPSNFTDLIICVSYYQRFLVAHKIPVPDLQKVYFHKGVHVSKISQNNGIEVALCVKEQLIVGANRAQVY